MREGFGEEDGVSHWNFPLWASQCPATLHLTGRVFPTSTRSRLPPSLPVEIISRRCNDAGLTHQMSSVLIHLSVFTLRSSSSRNIRHASSCLAFSLPAARWFWMSYGARTVRASIGTQAGQIRESSTHLQELLRDGMHPLRACERLGALRVARQALVEGELLVGHASSPQRDLLGNGLRGGSRCGLLHRGTDYIQLCPADPLGSSTLCTGVLYLGRVAVLLAMLVYASLC